MSILTQEAKAAEVALNGELGRITNGVVGVRRQDWTLPEGIRAIVNLTFDCEHDLVYSFVFPEEGENFAVLDYGFDPAADQRRRPFASYLKPDRIWSLAMENERYPFVSSDWSDEENGEDLDTHRAGVEVVALVDTYLKTV